MQYPRAWERFAAAFIDWLIYAVFIITFAGTLMVVLAFSSAALLRIVGFFAVVAATLIVIAVKVMFESGRLQATPGKLIFGLKVVDANGARAAWLPVLVRSWPWWIYLVTAITQMLLVGYWVHGLVWLALLVIFLTFFLPPGGRCLHDITSRLYVIKADGGMMGAR
jgi:uncharacterized RDD family membrane protein YckC